MSDEGTQRSVKGWVTDDSKNVRTTWAPTRKARFRAAGIAIRGKAFRTERNPSRQAP